MRKAWTLGEYVALPFSWCQLTVFADDRREFIEMAEALGFDLPRGWKKTPPSKGVGHSCGRDDLLHVRPLDGPGDDVAGAADAVRRVLDEADQEPARGPSYWRLSQAVDAAGDVAFCRRE